MNAQVRPQTVTFHTYADLDRVHHDKLASAGKSRQQISNFSSVLTSFMAFLGRNNMDPIGTDFGIDFSDNLDGYIKRIHIEGLKATTIKSRASYLRRYRGSAKDLLILGELPATLGDALRILIDRSGISINSLARSAGISCGSILSAWVRNEKNPGIKYLDAIPRLEKDLGAPEGSLQARLPTHLRGSFDSYQSGGTQYREKIKKLLKDPYAYINPCDAIRNEWADLIHFYTTPYLVDGRQRSVSWRVKKAVGSREKNWWFAKVSEGICQAAQMKWRHTASFLGYLLRSESKGGKGFQVKDLSLLLLTNADLAIGYIEFKRHRSGVYTAEVDRFLSFIITLTRAETGYLWQHDGPGRQLVETAYQIKDWHAWCEMNREKILTILIGLKKGGHIKKGRPPEEPIVAILALQHPVEALLDMVKNMESVRFGVTNKRIVARHFRNMLLVKMLISNPLRVSHFSIMTYRKDNTGNLHQRPDKSWCLRYEPEDFKNQRGAASEAYSVTLPEWLWQSIEVYLAEYRDSLYGADKLDYVFLPSSNGGKTKRPDLVNGWDSLALSRQMLRITQKYIPNSPGFGPHAFRHIIATEYIKNNPNGFQVVSDILHDRLSTILREYAHLKVADGFKFWSAYLTERVDSMKLEVSHE